MKYCMILIVLFACGNKAFNKESLNKYKSLSIPVFFQQLCINHQTAFSKIDNPYEQFCNQYSLNSKDSLTRQKFYTPFILHKIFTSKTAGNCSTGDIMNIPYQWHWTSPNPRHQIKFTKDHTLLKNTKPPKSFGNYASYADIDRTPYLYLTDFVQEEPKYFSESCGIFSTFGWCSEREMAFVCLMDLLGYEGKVIVGGPHSWSEYIIKIQKKQFKLKIDNTYNEMFWEEVTTQQAQQWRNKVPKEKLARWYDQKAHNATYKAQLKKYVVPEKAAQHIEKSIINYLQQTK